MHEYMKTLRRRLENISLTPCIVSQENNLSIFTTPIYVLYALILEVPEAGHRPGQGRGRGQPRQRGQKP